MGKPGTLNSWGLQTWHPLPRRRLSLRLLEVTGETFHLQGNRCPPPQELLPPPLLAAGEKTRGNSPQDLAGDMLGLIREGEVTPWKSCKN